MDNTAMDILEGKCKFSDVPVEHRSYAVCLAQLARNCYDFNWLPEECRTPELYMVAVRCSPASVVIKWIPEKHLTYDICYEAVTRFGDNLEYVPVKYRDTDMCLQAISHLGEVLHFVPLEIRDLELCKAVARAGRRLDHVPEQFKEEVYAYAASYKPAGVFLIPKKERTQVHYLLAYKAGLDVEDIPEEFITSEMKPRIDA